MQSQAVTVSASTKQVVRQVFARLDYAGLGPIYCDEGGDEFWKAKRAVCLRLGLRLANELRSRLASEGTSLYVGAGVAEIPPIAMESLDLGRRVVPCNLRKAEAVLLNRACDGLPYRFEYRDAGTVRITYDHLWLVSVLNDPERFPELSALSYGHANPAVFNGYRFLAQQRIVAALVNRCLARLKRPGLVTTTVEEVVWIAEWCHRRGIRYHIEERTFPSPTVGDPICLVKIGGVDARAGKLRG
ncbi:MAG: hypothetical protein NBKEAIPA_00847 [Nitrospirae bacterium]|nr:hypothetical protein [Nitrospirota bacterium]MCK6493649.1 hypothetical protein [Nitrospira sp.]MEB2338195.1 hypothetical protein [Nitrospirales bacterium]QOJ35254.1 MAG: hypothetical protein HRU82_09960 [Nitrospira sp.]